jgi:hypothetical protein
MDQESCYIPIMCHKVCQITKAEIELCIMCLRSPLTSVFPLYREMEISFRVFYVSLAEQWVWWCNNCLLKKSKRLWTCLTRKSCGRLWNPLWSWFCNLASLAFFLRRWTRMARLSGLAGLLGAGWKIPCQQNFVMIVWLSWYTGDQNATATQEVLGRKMEEGELLGAQHFRWWCKFLFIMVITLLWGAWFYGISQSLLQSMFYFL